MVAKPHVHADLPTAQPPGLRTLFYTEMWERFSYYGMRALLVLYLVNELGMPRGDALALYGLYTALMYVTPLLGAAITDRYLGPRRAMFAGGVLMMLGHLALAFEPLLHLALGLLIAGGGLFSPSSKIMVGQLYDGPADPRRAGGFSIYYMGVNLGAFLAPIVVGTLGETVGWHWGFACAAVGMAAGLAQFLMGQPRLGVAGLSTGQLPIGWADAPRLLAWVGAGVAVVVAVLFGWPLVSPLWVDWSTAAKVALAVAAMGALLAVFYGTGPAPEGPPLNANDWRRVAAITVVIGFVIAFWTGFEQAGGTMTLFADEQTERRIEWLGGWEMPASLFQSVNPLVIILLAPLFSMLWTALDRSRWALNDVVKQALGMLTLGVGFVVMAQAQDLADAHGRVAATWLLAVYVLHTLGELMLSPVCLSMVSKASPARIASLMMGVWALGIAASSYLAGAMESMLAGTGWALYPFLAAFSMGAGVLMLLLSPWLDRWLRAGLSR